jgi:hypothetical protein
METLEGLVAYCGIILELLWIAFAVFGVVQFCRLMWWRNDA